MTRRTLTDDQEAIFRHQVISSDQPGPVLHDFGVLLDFLRLEGVEASGKHQTLPARVIGELDGRLSRPLNLGLTRPQLRSHPYLLGLNLLLRASGLGVVEGAGSKARLQLDPMLTMQWDQLNPTERYFNLLEAALRFGRSGMVEDRESPWHTGLLFDALLGWQQTPKKGRTFDLKRPQQISMPGIYRSWYQLALLDLLGLMQVKHPPAPIKTWNPAGLRRVPFGDAVLTLLAGTVPEFADDPATVESFEEPEDLWGPTGVGAWQPLFQPYFPEWRRNLELPEPETREGMFIFRVSLGKAWRLIALPSGATLDDLADWILESVEFDNDHLYEFLIRNRFGVKRSVLHPSMEEPPFTSEVQVGELPLEPGESMVFHFDFGDDWLFNVTLERIDPSDLGKAPQILERHGKAPEQYPSWND